MRVLTVEWERTETFRTQVPFDLSDPEFVEWLEGEEPTAKLALEYLNAGDFPLEPTGWQDSISMDTRAVRADWSYDLG